MTLHPFDERFSACLDCQGSGCSACHLTGQRCDWCGESPKACSCEPEEDPKEAARLLIGPSPAPEPPRLVLPARGITLSDGWWADILWGGKDIENRSPTAITKLRGYRGQILLTSSKTDETLRTYRHLPDHREIGLHVGRDRWTGPVPFTVGHLRRAAGCAVGIATIVDATTP